MSYRHVSYSGTKQALTSATEGQGIPTRSNDPGEGIQATANGRFSSAGIHANRRFFHHGPTSPMSIDRACRVPAGVVPSLNFNLRYK